MATNGSAKILLMDDEEIVQRIAVRTLQRLGYDVAVANDGGGAVSLYSQALADGYPFSAVILDLSVPRGMGGCETLVHLRGIDPRVKAIASSGYALDDGLSDVPCSGFDAVLAKPYRPADLATTLENLLRA
jgi:two-component system, cell cycle sensor histidine kinase and response regulator CckA